MKPFSLLDASESPVQCRQQAKGWLLEVNLAWLHNSTVSARSFMYGSFVVLI
jgi:hypothetical protein